MPSSVYPNRLAAAITSPVKNAAPHDSRSKVSPMQPKSDERSRGCFPPRAEFGRAPYPSSKRCAVLCWRNTGRTALHRPTLGHLLAPPALSEGGHCGLARLGIAVRWHAILIVPES
jgi:hypothetical protein